MDVEQLFEAEVGDYGVLSFMTIGMAERFMVYRTCNEDGNISTIDYAKAITGVKNQRKRLINWEGKGPLPYLLKELFRATELETVRERSRIWAAREMESAAEHGAEFCDVLLGHSKTLIDAYRIFSLISIMTMTSKENSYKAFMSETGLALSEILECDYQEGVSVTFMIWEYISVLKEQLWVRRVSCDFERLEKLRAVRRAIESIVADYGDAMSNHTYSSGKPLVMQVKVEHSLFQFFGQSVWDTYSGVQERQFPTLANVTNRVRFSLSGRIPIAIMCEPDKVVLGLNTAWGVPIPRYALLQLEYAKFNMLGRFLVRSGLIGEDGQRVKKSSRGHDYEFEIDMELYDDTASEEIAERQILVSGPQVPDGLLSEHINTVILHCDELVLKAREATRFILQHPKFNSMVKDAAERYKGILDLGNKTSPMVEDHRNGDELKVIRHADLDDSVRQLKYPIDLGWGSRLSRPSGTEWKERVLEEWEGDLNGSYYKLKLDQKSGTITKMSKTRWLAPNSESISVEGQLNLGIFSCKVAISKALGRKKNEFIHPSEILRSSTPSDLVRMALFASEMSGECYSQNSACYLKKGSDNTTNLRNHIASIASGSFSGQDVYFRKRDRAVFILTAVRSLRLKPGTAGNCKYHVEEAEFDKRECILAYMELEAGKVGG